MIRILRSEMSCRDPLTMPHECLPFQALIEPFSIDVMSKPISHQSGHDDDDDDEDQNEIGRNTID